MDALKDALNVGWLCLFRAVTGLPCPGCGLTRAARLMAGGHFIQAERMNILSVPLLCGGLYAAIALALEKAGMCPLYRRTQKFLYAHRKAAIGLAAFFALSSWAYNIYMGR